MYFLCIYLYFYIYILIINNNNNNSILSYNDPNSISVNEKKLKS